MAHFAQLDENNKVIQVIVVNNDVIQNLPFPESEPIGVAFCQSLLGENTIWKQTSYNANFRNRYAIVEAQYDPEKDEFTELRINPDNAYFPVEESPESIMLKQFATTEEDLP